MLVASRKTFSRNEKPNPVHSFDSGASFENLALQGSAMRLVVHGMAGFDQDMAREKLNLPDNYEPEAMVAIGRPGDPASLPDNKRKLETPSERKAVSEISCSGPFNFQ